MTKRKSFTLVEMLITVVILGIIFIPLVKIMVSSLRTWWMSKSKMTIQEDGRESLAYLVNEFKGSFRYSLGSLISNGGFEGATYDQTTGIETPSWWQVPDGEDIAYILSASTNYVCSGVYSIRLHAPGVTYAYNGSGNNGFSVDYDISKLILCFKAKAYPGTGPTDITGEIKQDGVATSVISTGTAGAVTLSSSTWERFTVIGSISAGDNYRVVFNTANGDVLIDNVSVVPKESILLTMDPSETPNVSGYKYESQVTGGMTAVKETEIRIEQRASSSGNTIKRLCLYRIDSSGGTNPVYVVRFYNALAENVKELKFILDAPDAEVATKGYDVPVTIDFKLGINVKFKGGPTYFTLRTTIFPRD